MKRQPRTFQFYGHGIPSVQGEEVKGRLIVIEGPDASGRSTQIGLITARLEAEGHAVLSTGLKRSELISEGILEAKRNFAGRRTLSLFYAADFADQLENKIIPALRAGYIVLADRYIYTMMAREAVRGISRRWSHNLFSFAVTPDLVYYL
ncbi:MAG: dTMP kinase, partial [Nitrososphaera sp.]|uniref:dTMP kinase n=1 Tax=Nitrososphaera sp. TaxID=1971748 RepID=UPI003D701EDF